MRTRLKAYREKLAKLAKTAVAAIMMAVSAATRMVLEPVGRVLVQARPTSKARTERMASLRPVAPAESPIRAPATADPGTAAAVGVTH